MSSASTLDSISICHRVMLSSVDHFKLTKFVVDYFSQEFHGGPSYFIGFLNSLLSLESLELHSDEFHRCPPEILDRSFSIERLRLAFGNLTKKWETKVLRGVLFRNSNAYMKSLALFLKQKRSHFPEIIRVTALEIHQIFPSQVEKDLSLPANLTVNDEAAAEKPCALWPTR